MPRGSGGNIAGFKLLSTPNAPTDLSVTAGLGNLTVSFTAPVDTGDADVTEYVVTTLNESSNVSTGTVVASSPASISLGTGTFSVRVQALNDFGPGQLTEYDTGNTILYTGAELYSWGWNDDGILGDGTKVDKSSPIQVGALTNWSDVYSGSKHTLSIKTNGTLWAWGSNFTGRLGINNTIDKSSPVQVGSLTNWYQGSAGNNFSAAVKTDGTLWAWGSGGYGVLGLGNTTSFSSPVQVGALATWALAASGRDCSFAIKTDGTLWSWGRNYRGQLGQGTTVDFSSPVQVGASSDWSSVVGGQTFTLALKTTGTLWAWGANSQGQLGQNNTILRSSPVQIGALNNWKQVSAGVDAYHSVAVKTDGTLWAWGSGNDGQLGQNNTISLSSPVQVGASTDWARVTAGSFAHTIAIKTDGTLWSWGTGTNGVLGDGTTTDRSSPVQVGALTSWIKVTSGSTFNVALVGTT